MEKDTGRVTLGTTNLGKIPSMARFTQLLWLVFGFAFLPASGAIAADHPQLLGRLEGSGGRCVSFSADGKRLLTADVESARIWDVQSLKPLTKPIKHGADINSAVWIADDARIATIGGNDVKFWDVQSGEMVSRIAHDLEVGPAAVSPDGKWTITANARDGATLWSTITAKRARVLEELKPLYWAAFNDDGTRLLTYILRNPKNRLFGGTLRVQDVETGKNIIPPQATDYNGFGNSMAKISPDGTRIVIANAKGYSVYQIDGFKKISRQEENDADSLDGGYTEMVFFTPDGTRVIWVCNGFMGLFHADSGQPVRRLMRIGIVGEQEIDVSRANSLLLVGGLPEYAGIWDVASGKRLQNFGEETSSCVAFSPDGKRAAIGYAGPAKDHASYTEIWKVDAGP